MKLFRKHGLKRELWKHFRSSPVLQLLAVLLVFSVVNGYLLLSSSLYIDGRLRQAEDAARPASLQLVSIVSSGCPECFDVSRLVSSIKALNVKITGERTMNSDSNEAKSLISKYAITRIPALIVSGETTKAGLDAAWSQFGTKESDGSLVMRYGAPYIDLSTGVEFGRAQLMNIVDKSCSTCYNVSMQENILKNGYGMVFSSVKTYDVSSSEGARLVLLYNITKVPTMIISPDAKYYEGLQGTWKQVGSIEKDGYYVFRNMQALRGIVYKDLSTGSTVTAA